jgi:deoxyribonucleoside regulator
MVIRDKGRVKRLVPNMYNQSTFLVLKAAYLFYIQNKTQTEIAQILGVSIATVSRLIKKAIKEKIIQFVITDPYLECIEMEAKIKKTFGLKDVVIAPILDLNLDDPYCSENDDNARKLVALEGARYIQRIITEDDIFGISWGKTMYYLIHYLLPSQKVNTTFVTLHGSVDSIEHEQDVRTLVARMAMSFGGKKYSLLAESLMSNSRLVNSIKKEKNISKVFEIYNKLTISVCGIGSFYPQETSVMATSGYLTPSELQELRSQDVAGDMIMRFFDKEGKECETSLKNRTLAIDWDIFKKIKTKIVVAAGPYKTQTILCALKSNLIDVLITDYYLGKSLLENNA